VKQSVAEVSGIAGWPISHGVLFRQSRAWLARHSARRSQFFPLPLTNHHEETSLGVAALVEEATAELAFWNYHQPFSCSKCKEIWNEPFYAVCPPTMRWQTKKNIGLQQLTKIPLLVKRGGVRSSKP